MSEDPFRKGLTRAKVSAPKEAQVPIEIDTLRTERDRLKESLRQLEAEQRTIESELKALRQREVRTKREIEALSTLIELAEARAAGDKGEPVPEKAEEITAR